jgi:hypothetical protein
LEAAADEVAEANRCPGLGCEHEVARLGPPCGERSVLVLPQEGGERWHQLDVAFCGRSLWLDQVALAVELVAHPDGGRGQVDVLPAQAELLALTETGEDRERDRDSVLVGCGPDEFLDLVAVEDALLVALDPGPLATLQLPNRVLRDQASPRRVTEHPAEDGDSAADRPRCVRALTLHPDHVSVASLEADAALHVRDQPDDVVRRDIGESQPTKPRLDVHAQVAAVQGKRLWS